MKNILLICSLVIMILAQLFFPLQMIYDNEKSLADGRVYKFKTEPIDPADPFRGKYIRLSVRHTTTKLDTSIFPERNGKLFVEVENDSAGFARVKNVFREEPTELTDYVEAYYRYRRSREDAVITYPFKRFYMEESKAKPAENLYWSNRTDRERNCYVQVSILEGDFVINDVFIDDKPIAEAVQEIIDSTQAD
ncbi:MAG: GDYXXLXY domain-containing protein [Flavobacteriales bacterium]|nr:GDYXXLXY domain-containing protein [Flavobacteriales bacterium]